MPPEDGGRFAEVYADATTVWPLLIKAVMEELGLTPAARSARGAPAPADTNR